MNILTTYYYVSAGYLKEYLPCIPKLKLSNAKGYYGQIEHNGNNEFTIRLSKWNLDCGPIHWWDEEDINELIDTICHEFAHLLFWEHGENHTKATKEFTKVVKSSLKIRELENRLKELKIGA